MCSVVLGRGGRVYLDGGMGGWLSVVSQEGIWLFSRREGQPGAHGDQKLKLLN